MGLAAWIKTNERTNEWIDNLLISEDATSVQFIPEVTHCEVWTYNDNVRHDPVNMQTIERVIISGGSYKDSLAIMLTFHLETWPLANYEDIFVL